MLSSKDSEKLPDTLEDSKSSDSHSDSDDEQKKAGEASAETKKLIIKFKVGSCFTFHRHLSGWFSLVSVTPGQLQSENSK